MSGEQYQKSDETEKSESIRMGLVKRDKIYVIGCNNSIKYDKYFKSLQIALSSKVINNVFFAHKNKRL